MITGGTEGRFAGVLLSAALLLSALGCDEEPTAPDAGAEDAGDPPTDAGDPPMDAGDLPMDAGDPPMDAGDPPMDAGDTGDGGADGCTPATVAVCGRSADGLFCATTDGTGDVFGAGSIWNDALSDAEGWDANAAYWGTIRFPDVNGDGHADVCARAASGIICALYDAAAGRFDTETGWTGELGDPREDVPDASIWATLQFPDLDGDGADDVCARAVDGLRCGLSNGTDAFEGFSIWDERFTDPNGWSHVNYWSTLQFADLDGDGDDDFCARSASTVVCGLSDGSTFTSGPWLEAGLAPEARFADGAVPSWTLPSYRNTIHLVDLDADGDADLCGRYADGIHCALSDGSTFGTPSRWSNGFSNAGGWDDGPSYWGTISFADIDGDGDADICGRGANDLVCALSNGADAFETRSTWTTDLSDEAGFGSPRYWTTIQLPDIDSDGDADLCARNSAGIGCARSNGTDGFGSFELWSTEFPDADRETQRWSRESRYRTIRFPVVDPGTCERARDWELPWVTGGQWPRAGTGG
jgi:hypothetical protein